jgi:hypothetical protein
MKLGFFEEIASCYYENLVKWEFFVKKYLKNLRSKTTIKDIKILQGY